MKGIKEMKTLVIFENPFHPLHPCKYLLLIAAFFVCAEIVAARDSGRPLERTVVKLSDGIYTIRHKDAPDTFPQGNTTVIIGDREVLVVDSCYLPTSAREDIAEIRRWTNKPVRYLVNTHWHFDHTMGNGTYWEAFPGLNIVAHMETARQSSGYNPGWFERFPKRGDRLKQILEAGKDGNVVVAIGLLCVLASLRENQSSRLQRRCSRKDAKPQSRIESLIRILSEKDL